jgi:hypothetical protein
MIIDSVRFYCAQDMRVFQATESAENLRCFLFLRPVLLFVYNISLKDRFLGFPKMFNNSFAKEISEFSVRITINNGT